MARVQPDETDMTAALSRCAAAVITALWLWAVTPGPAKAQGFPVTWEHLRGWLDTLRDTQDYRVTVYQDRAMEGAIRLQIYLRDPYGQNTVVELETRPDAAKTGRINLRLSPHYAFDASEIYGAFVTDGGLPPDTLSSLMDVETFEEDANNNNNNEVAAGLVPPPLIAGENDPEAEEETEHNYWDDEGTFSAEDAAEMPGEGFSEGE